MVCALSLSHNLSNCDNFAQNYFHIHAQSDCQTLPKKALVPTSYHCNWVFYRHFAICSGTPCTPKCHSILSRINPPPLFCHFRRASLFKRIVAYTNHLLPTQPLFCQLTPLLQLYSPTHPSPPFQHQPYPHPLNNWLRQGSPQGWESFEVQEQDIFPKAKTVIHLD